MSTPIKRKTVVTDPEGNKVTTRTRTTDLFGPKGSSKVTTKFVTPESFKKRNQKEYFDPPIPSDEELGIKRKGGATKTKMRTGGMVNANAKIAAAKKATGRVGGTSKAPKKASIKKK